jgi:hypothetical protein
MNHIPSIRDQRDEALARIADANQALIDLIVYYTSEKFRVSDHAHVSTDILPRLRQVLNALRDE